jgi:ABC-type microcin C transport system duplicated ATPase subunit YejF
MGQRAMIAMMLICRPELLIADEPTSALDVTVQFACARSILDDLVTERGMGLIFISHDLRLVSSRSATVSSSCMAAGRRGRCRPANLRCGPASLYARPAELPATISTIRRDPLRRTLNRDPEAGI